MSGDLSFNFDPPIIGKTVKISNSDHSSRCGCNLKINTSIETTIWPSALYTWTIYRDRRGCDRMVVGFTTTYAVSAYHH
jgi:hypothetical protein